MPDFWILFCYLWRFEKIFRLNMSQRRFRRLVTEKLPTCREMSNTFQARVASLCCVLSAVFFAWPQVFFFTSSKQRRDARELVSTWQQWFAAGDPPSCTRARRVVRKAFVSIQEVCDVSFSQWVTDLPTILIFFDHSCQDT